MAYPDEGMSDDQLLQAAGITPRPRFMMPGSPLAQQIRQSGPAQLPGQDVPPDLQGVGPSVPAPSAPQVGPGMPNPQSPPPPAGQSPEAAYYNMMLGLSDLGSQERTLKGQSALANSMRDSPMPEMRDAGRFKVAPNPMESLNAGIRQGYGGYKMGQNLKAQSDLAAQIRQRIQEERDRQMGGGGAPQPPMGGVTPDMMVG